MSIRRIVRAVDRYSKHLVKTSGLSVTQLLVMHAVRQRGNAATNLVAKDVCLSQPTVTTIIDRLESQGFLYRERSPDDRRVVHIGLTAAAEQKLDESPELIQEDFVRAFDGLDRWEQQMILSTLERVAQMLNADGSDPAPTIDIGAQGLMLQD